jgi:hypothetical protein
MAKKSITITIDEELVASVQKDRGLAPLSTFMNRLLEIIYSPESEVSADLQACRKLMGSRNTPETIQHLLMEAIAPKRKELDARKGHGRSKGR